MKKILLSLFVIPIILLPNMVSATPDRGTLLSMSCAACHGTDGKSPGAMPSLYGKSSKYIETSMLNFLQGKRVATVMNRIAKVNADGTSDIKVSGHTDDVPLARGGQYPSNWELAASRGVALLRSLEAMGVSESKMSVVSYAHTRPKIPYRNLSGSELRRARAANRRVVIWLE